MGKAAEMGKDFNTRVKDFAHVNQIDYIKLLIKLYYIKQFFGIFRFKESS